MDLDRYGNEPWPSEPIPRELEVMCDCPVWTLPESPLETREDLRVLGAELSGVTDRWGKEPPV